MTLVLFSRSHDDPAAKSRLRKTTGLPAPFVQSLHNAFIDDSLRALHAQEHSCMYCWATPSACHDDDSNTFFQKGSHFTDRFLHCLHTLHEKQIESCAIIGSDTPQLTGVELQCALEYIQADSFCIGPARAGGLYLIGGNVARLVTMPWQQIFTHWNQPQAFMAATAGEKTYVLEPVDDIDTADDLLHLMMLFSLNLDFSIAPNTRKLLNTINPTPSTIDTRTFDFQIVS